MGNGNYIYYFKNNPKRITMKNRRCDILAYGAKNSCLIEFIDNKQREIVSRNAIRKYLDVKETNGKENKKSRKFFDY